MKTEKILIYVAVAVAAYWLYTKYQANAAAPATTPLTTTGTLF